MSTTDTLIANGFVERHPEKTKRADELLADHEGNTRAATMAFAAELSAMADGIVKALREKAVGEGQRLAAQMVIDHIESIDYEDLARLFIDQAIEQSRIRPESISRNE